jgi:AcrR family transcriptional regulator
MKHTTTDSKREDRRVEKTRTALLEALLELIVEKGYEQTTVQDVLDRANVGRATFYTHYFNKKDLLLRRMSVFRLDVAPADGDRRRMPDVTRIFEHVASQRDLYLAMRGTEGLDAALAVARADLTESFEKLFRAARSNGDDREVHFFARFFTGALLLVMTTWLDEGMPDSPAMMSRRFREFGEHVLSPAR